VILLTLAACAGGGEPEAPINNAPASIAEATFADSLEIDLAASTRHEAGLYWRDLVPGNGPAVESGQLVDVHYDGRLPDGSRFDASAPGDPFTFRAGVGSVIAGWDLGVVGMRIGGTRQLIIPPELGYGPMGSGPIPPNATLIFTVEVLAAR
jgi:peptidylprolyl isomerase